MLEVPGTGIGIRALDVTQKAWRTPSPFHQSSSRNGPGLSAMRRKLKSWTTHATWLSGLVFARTFDLIRESRAPSGMVMIRDGLSPLSRRELLRAPLRHGNGLPVRSPAS